MTEPSAQARRAAEELACAIRYAASSGEQPSEGIEDRIAEIIERETGAGEALAFIRELSLSNGQAVCIRKSAEGNMLFNWSDAARAFLARFKQD